MNDSDYIKIVHGMHVRIRTFISTSKGDVQSFYVQLELNLSPNPEQSDKWVDVARFDHQPDKEQGHDITKEGLHMDICHPHKKDRKTRDFPHIELNDAPDYCERYFEKNYAEICDRYADWYGLIHWDWTKNPIR